MIQYFFVITDVDCGKPDDIQHGRYTLTSNATYYGAASLYECDSNYELDGFARRLCLENGTWSSETPVCKGIIEKNSYKFILKIIFERFAEIKCKDPDKVGIILTQTSTHGIGGIAHYHCPKGYYMEGNSTRICLQNGSWSGRSPSCFRELTNF